MTKAAKARMIAYYEAELSRLDRLIELNSHHTTATDSLLSEYKKLVIQLAKLRDTPTAD